MIYSNRLDLALLLVAVATSLFVVDVTAQEAANPKAAQSGGDPLLAVANRSSHEVTFVDLARGEIVARIATGEGPHLLSNFAGGRLLATGYGQFPRPHTKPVSKRPPFVTSLNSRLSVIDAASRSVILDRSIDGCANPHASWIIEGHGYVTCETERQVAMLDLETGDVVKRFDTQQEGSHVLAFDPKARMLSVSNTDSGSVTLIDIDSAETRVVELAAGSEGARIVEHKLWVGNAGDRSVSVISLTSATEIARTADVCSFPIAFDQAVNRRVWVACFGSSELVAMSPETFSVIRRVDLADQPLNLILHPTGMLAYVSLPRQNAVAEVDLTSGDELRRIAVGIEPDGLRWIHH